MWFTVLILFLVLQSKTRAQVDEADFYYSQIQEENLEQGSGQELAGSENDLIGSGDNLITGSGVEEDLR